MKIFDQSLTRLERALDYSSKRNQVITNNIANVDTPFYKAKDVVFKTHLQQAMEKQLDNIRTHPKHFKFSSNLEPYQIITDNNTIFNHNGNNVDMDKEMANLAKNQIYYRAVTDFVSGKFNTLRNVIRGGR